MRAFARNYTSNSILDEHELLFIISLTLMLPHQKEDSDIIQRIVHKEKDALYLLYDKYSAALFGVIVRICQNQELAEDVLQETFLRIWVSGSEQTFICLCMTILIIDYGALLP